MYYIKISDWTPRGGLNIEHGVTKDPPFQIHVLEFIHRNPATKEGAEILDEHEKMWMGRLNTYYPNGLNIQD